MPHCLLSNALTSTAVATRIFNVAAKHDCALRQSPGLMVLTDTHNWFAGDAAHAHPSRRGSVAHSHCAWTAYGQTNRSRPIDRTHHPTSNSTRDRVAEKIRRTRGSDQAIGQTPPFCPRVRLRLARVDHQSTTHPEHARRTPGATRIAPRMELGSPRLSMGATS